VPGAHPAVFRNRPAIGEFTAGSPGLPVTGRARRGVASYSPRTGLYTWGERTGERRRINDPQDEVRSRRLRPERPLRDDGVAAATSPPQDTPTRPKSPRYSALDSMSHPSGGIGRK
jgi:hypothetical protein